LNNIPEIPYSYVNFLDVIQSGDLFSKVEGYLNNEIYSKVEGYLHNEIYSFFHDTGEIIYNEDGGNK